MVHNTILGRPRTFDVDTALDTALALFWQRGYKETSIVDLTTAMHINKPSLYAAFGNKQDLFVRVLDHYESKFLVYLQQAFKQPTTHRLFVILFEGVARHVTNPLHPAKGCLLVRSALTCNEEDWFVRNAIERHRQKGQEQLKARLEELCRGSEQPDVDAASLTQYALIVCDGLAIQAASGGDQADLLTAARLAIPIAIKEEKL